METKTVRVLDGDEVSAAMLRARREFVSRLEDRFPDPGDPVRLQVEPMVARWWPVSSHPVMRGRRLKAL